MSESASESTTKTSEIVEEFRVDLRYDSYFGEALHNDIHEAVKRSANAFEKANNVNIPDKEVSKIATELTDASHAALESETTGDQ